VAGLVVPNAGSGASAELIAQASSDTVDWTILSMSQMGYGVLITAADAVLTPCKVTAQASPNSTVQVAAGNLTGGGGIYSPAATASLSIASNSSGSPRFDLVVYRIGTGYTVIQGTPAPAPFTAFPTPTWNTDIVLAAIYVADSFGTITNAEIVDKRQPIDFYDWSVTLAPPVQLVATANAHGTALKTLSIVTLNIGDLVVLSVYAAGATVTVTAVSGGGVNTWNKLTSLNTSSAYGDLAVWWGVVSTAGTATATITTTAAGTIYLLSATVTASLGPSTTWTVDQQATATSTSASGTFPSVWNSGYSPEFYVGAMSAASGSPGGSTAGFTYDLPASSNLALVHANNPGAAAPGSSASNNLVPGWTATAGDQQFITATFAPSAPPITPVWLFVGAAGQPTFGTGWSNAGGSAQTVSFRRIGDKVELRGNGTSNGTTTTAFTLPSGYRPLNQLQQAATVGAAVGVITVQGSGAVLLSNELGGAVNGGASFDFSFSVS
jgi:hypothetical protein